jgi:hypothetical protein
MFVRKIILVTLLLIHFSSFSQLKQGQQFCDERQDDDYFSIKIQKKIIFWANTYYIETIEGEKEINGNKYSVFRQVWEDKTVSLLYLREDNGVIYQFEDGFEKETIRYDKKYKIGYSWKTIDGKGNYKITSYSGHLKTPYCSYNNLLVIEADLEFGKYKFYYYKGFGYIGATKNDKIISCLSPELPEN